MFQAKDFCVDYEVLIAEVKKHPALYDGSIESYNDRSHRYKEWIKVFKVLVPEWDSLDNANRITLEKEIQKKWRNIRDSFVKDLKKKALHEASASKIKWRKYIYHDQLQFLMGCMGSRKNPQPTNTVHLESSAEENTNDVPILEVSAPPPKRPRPKDPPKDFEAQLIQVLSDHKRHEGHHEVDDDRYFLLSMLPSFKNLDEETKLKTRIEMLQVLQRSVSACNQARNESMSSIFVPKLEFDEPPSPSYESLTSFPSSTCNHVD